MSEVKNNFYSHEYVKSECIYGVGAKSNVNLTIVVPTFKRKELLQKAILSIVNQKQPNHMTYQVIIVSNDSEYSVGDLDSHLDKAHFTVYRNRENLGMVGNMNRCARLAEGDYIAYLQDDDILLEDYLISVENILENDLKKEIDCLIPNRYYFYDKNDKNSIFGHKAYIKEGLKSLLKKSLCLGKKTKLLQKVTVKDCYETWYNCFSGGPTCGMLFKRSALMATTGFNDEYPFAFDYVFLLDFSTKNNVYLYNKTLSIYRMNDSASNRPEVQLDFFKSEMYLLDKMSSQMKVKNSFKQEIIKFSLESNSLEAQKLIGTSGTNSANKLKYFYFRIARFILLMRRLVYRRELMPEEYLDIV